jgi:transcriptional regulator with XRE-family HTH domain
MLGPELRKARLAAGMTQEQVSNSAKVDRSYISDLERDKQSPTVDMLFRLCRAMGASASEIISRVERADKQNPHR